jgi:heme exporter protein C
MVSAAPRWLLFSVASVATAVTLALPDARGFREPALARIVATHLPCAVLCSFFLVLSAVVGIRYLARRDPALDRPLAASLELGAVFGSLTMATGVLFSQVQWGTWWQWDPRQTSFLVVLLLQASGVLLRGATPDPQRRAAAASAYAAATLLPGLFLVFVFPRLPQVQAASLHPSRTVESGGFDWAYWSGIAAMSVALALWARCAYVARVRALQQHELDADRAAPAPSGLVVPLDVPEER